MAIDWNPKWNIGYDKIDEQHQRWAGILNQLEIAFIRGEVDQDTQQSLLTQLLDYTRNHFADEEKLMSRIEYPDTISHRRLHKDFDNLIYEKFRMTDYGNIILTSEIIQMMKNWLYDHILIEDKKIGEYLKGLKHQS